MKNNLILWIFLIFNFALYAQETPKQETPQDTLKEVKLTFNDKELSNGAADIRNGEYYQIKIEGLNTFLYDVMINDEDISIAAEELPIITDLFLFDGITDIVGNINSQINLMPTDSVLSNKQNSLSENQQQVFMNIAIYDEGLIDVIAKVPDSLKSDFIEYVLLKFSLGYKDHLDSLQQIAVKLEKNYEHIYKYQRAIQYVDKRPEIDDLDPDMITKIQDTLIVYRAQFKSFSARHKLLNQRFEKFKTAFKTTIDSDNNLKVYVKHIEESKAILATALEKIAPLVEKEKFNQALEILPVIYNHRNFEYTSFPYQVKEDAKDITIALKPRGEKSTLPSYSSSFRIPNKETNFWGVSTGLYLTKNRNENYSLFERIERSTPETEVAEGEEEPEPVETSYYSLYKEDTPKHDIGFKAMVFHGWNLFDRQLFFSLGLGGGISITDTPKPRIFFAPGIAYGKKNKITLEIGAAYIFYDKLSRAYDVNTEYSARPVDYMITDADIQIYYGLGYTIKLGGSSSREE